MQRTLYVIAGAIRTLLLIDNVTKNKLFGLYARVLVDLDLSKDIFYEVMVEQGGFEFPVEIEYEGLPEFFTHCKSIGHNVTSCCWLHLEKKSRKTKEAHSRERKETSKLVQTVHARVEAMG